MKFRILTTIFLVILIAYAGMSVGKNDAFSLADDLPRGALVYAQFSDFPGIIKRWNDSALKEQYLQSQNFKELSNRHLGLKLASRWQEFNDAAGFPFDLDTLAGLSSGKAAVGIYDIGKLDFVFVAPVSEELFLATNMMQDGSRFETEDWGNEVKVHRIKIEADHGRQNQSLLFTYYKGKLILATSEKLLSRTLSNLQNKGRKDRLSDEQSFAALKDRMAPHKITVWTNQTALNDDYYFKRYWLMGNVDKLNNIRAGMFDVALDSDPVVEQREFLLEKAVNSTNLDPAIARKLISNVPPESPFYKLAAWNSQNVSETLQNIISSPKEPESASVQHYTYRYSDITSDDFSKENFTYLGDSFDENINDAEDEKVNDAPETNSIDFYPLLKTARPNAIITFSEPETLPAPLFVEFRKAAVISLQSPANFDRSGFETAIEKAVLSRTTVNSKDITLQWNTKSSDGIEWRELELPMLGWGVSYIARGNELFLSNNSEFLLEVVKAKGNQYSEQFGADVSELTVLNLGEMKDDYFNLFQILAGKDQAADFFTGNIGGLLKLNSAPKKIKIRQDYEQNFLREKIEIFLN